MYTIKNIMLALALSAFLIFFYAKKSEAQSNIFPPSGKVGIGTTNPLFGIDLIANGDNSDGLSVTNSNTGGSARSILRVRNDGGELGQFSIFSTNHITLPNWATFEGTKGLRIGTDAGIPNGGVSVFQVVTGGYDANPSFTILGSGKTGIGISNPSSNLHVKSGMNSAGDISLEGSGDAFSYANVYVKRNGTHASGQVNYWNTLNYRMDDYFGGGPRSLNFYSAISNGSSEGLLGYRAPLIITESGNVILVGAKSGSVLNNGYVGIGLNNPDEKLTVNGSIRSHKLKVTQTGWPDFVFRKDYLLIPLDSLESFISKYNHLPDIPSKEEIEKNGLDVGANQAALLKKIEELTLYVIELNKKVGRLEKIVVD